jgi:two-component system sensor histidine kinase PilS (NtrC family)
MAAHPCFAGVTVVPEMADDLMVSVDVGLFKQVLWNLFMNAAESMGGAGVLRITARSDAGGDLGNGNGVLIAVADEGVGMSAEVKGRIFEPFFTTKDHGSGLGMATVYRILEAHGGRISVESEPGRGTTFELFLPEEPVLAEGGEL